MSFLRRGYEMKIKNKKSFILFMGWAMILCVPLLSSCVTEEKLAYTNDQINLTNKRISSVEESVDKTIDQKLSVITANQAALRVEIDQLKDNMRSISGRVEENEYLVKHSVEKDLTSQDTTRTDISSLSSRLGKVEAIVNQQQKYLNIDEGQAAAPPPQGDATAAAPSGAGGQATTAQDSGEKYAYDSTMALFNDKKYDEAMSGFKKFLEQYPKSELAGNAQFWTGECLMDLKEYEQAILAFEDVVKKYPKNIKVPNAMLRQAIAFLEINDKTSSTVLLKKVIKQFPKSNEAKLAQKKLETMK
jgi:tol-pal system protein YbgF